MSLHRFLTRLIWLCVLPLVLLAAYLAIARVNNAQSERNFVADRLAHDLAKTVDQDLNARIGALRMLGMSPLADSAAGWRDLYQEAQAFRQSFGSHVIFADPDRHVRFSTRTPFGTTLPQLTLLPQPKGHSAVRAALETGQPAVGDLFAGPVANESMVAVAAPVRRDGKTLAVLLTTITTRELQNRIEEAALPPGWSLTLRDGTGEVIAHRGPADSAESNDADQARRVLVRSATSPWSVRVEIPRDVYHAPLVEASAVVALVVLGTILAGVLGGTLASRRLSRAVASLANAPAPKAGATEITELAAVRHLVDEAHEERDQAEAAGRDSERHFRAVFEQAAMGISLVAPDGRILRVNQKLCEITGYPEDEQLAKTFQDITHPDDLEANLSCTRQLLAGDIDTFSMEKRYLRKDGGIVWINLTVALVRRSDGSPDYFISVVEDIHRRKDAEAALMAREATLKEAQRLSSLGNWSWDLRADRHVWSEEIYRIFGRESGSPPVVFPGFRTCFTTDSWEQLAAAVEHCRSLGTPYECDAEVLRPDGTHRWIVARGEATRDADGAIVELHGTVQDITERKQAREKLRVSDLALKSISQGVLITNADGLILSANDAFSSITGFSEAEILGRSCRFVQGPLTDPRTVASIRLARDNVTDFSGEILNYRKDGRTFWNELTISPVHDERGRLTHFIGIIRDITERKLAADDLDQQQQHLEELVQSRTAALAQARDAAESANKAKSAFLAAMSHEIRTPLNAVVGLTRLISDSPLDRRQRDYADKIQLSAQALRALIDDILDFSKIEAGALQLEQAPFSLNAILRVTATVVSVGTRDKAIETLFDVASDIPDALVGDALRLQQILLNLTSNAVKFTTSGVIVVSVRCLSREDGHATLQFAVRDTGIGIAPDQLGLIFDAFAQADTSISRTHGGTGLGLAIGARLAALMGGQITVDSTLGQGSEFRFAVPLALADGEPPAAPGKDLSGLRILIIDDHPLARDLLQRACAGFGWQATAIDSGAAGLGELRRSTAEGHAYDLLLLDWRMPGMDGLEMLRLAYGSSDIGLPLVVLMAPLYDMEEAVAAADDLHLDGIVAKPITPASLHEAMVRAYSGEFTGILPPSDKMDRRLSGMRLLVAEDNDLNQEVFKQILMRAGAEVVIAADGQAAVEALRVPAARFDAVLMDIHMPVMDGYTATRLIREELGRTDLPIIAVTAYAQPEDREKSRLAGMVGHVVKPIDVEKLLDILKKEHRHPNGKPAAASRQAPPPAIRFAGFDVATALKAFGGDEEKLGALLRKFVDRHGGDANEAARLFSAGDQKGAARLVHDLRGMAGLLQASEVALLAAAAESAIQENCAEAVPPLLSELQTAMRALTGSVNEFEARRVG